MEKSRLNEITTKRHEQQNVYVFFCKFTLNASLLNETQNSADFFTDRVSKKFNLNFLYGDQHWQATEVNNDNCLNWGHRYPFGWFFSVSVHAKSKRRLGHDVIVLRIL